VESLEQILASIEDSFDLQPQAEITLEANPGTLSQSYLSSLCRIGINRLSLGVQSANSAELRLLERLHDYPTVTHSVAWARQAGFENLNLDLIFGLPEQPIETWQQTLRLAAGLQPEHFSLYALSLEHGTPFGRWAKRGLLSTPDPDLAADMYEWASEFLDQNGYAQYEISNWARRLPPDASASSPALACRHNLQYWRNQPYLGFGAGAHGYAAAQRTANVLSPAIYIERLSAPAEQRMVFPRTPATQNLQTIDRASEIGETMMMGLRLVREGVSAAAFQRRFGQSLEEVFPRQIARFTGYGLLEWLDDESGRRLRLTSRGRLLGNQVFSEFI
jgi:oxygen-independent coproporphyrinogen-3 oxidase